MLHPSSECQKLLNKGETTFVVAVDISDAFHCVMAMGLAANLYSLDIEGDLLCTSRRADFFFVFKN